MRFFPRLSLCTALAAVLMGTPALAQQALPGTGEDAGKTVVYRDTWGIPHIYAPTAEAGLFAMGWAQAEDRPEELLKNLLRGLGESASFEGPGSVQADMIAHMWRHYERAQSGMDSLNPAVRGHLEAFAAGVNAYYAAHPDEIPSWWGERQVDAAMLVAFGRMFLFGWSIDDGFGDLQRGGIQPGIQETARASNQFAVAPQRSASGNAILYIDPHLAWFGPSRFWEFRMHAGDLEGSGFGLAGVPYIGLGHNANMAWAMTTGAPDTADVYALTLNPDNPMQYAYDGGWKDLTAREVTIQVKDSDPVTTTLYDSHYGPVVAMKDNKAYALKMAYADVVNGNEAWYLLNVAKDYTGAVAAMKTGTMFPQNVMVADTSGNIYYQRSGRVPKRPEGYDWDRPVDGSTSATEWLGFHDSDDHVQILNPEQGYMQNCNNPPDAMMVNSPLQPDKYPPYLFSDLGYGKRGGWTTPRGARAVDLLSKDDSVTIEEALDYALDVHPYGVENWIAILSEGHAAHGAKFADNADYMAGIADILAWDQQLRRYSTGALKYYYWRKQLLADYGESVMREVIGAVDQFYKAASGAPYTKAPLGEEEYTFALESFAKAMAALRGDFHTLDVTWGEVFRVGRDDQSWPVGGGGDGEFGTITLRNVKYGRTEENLQRMGRAGQTSTQIVELSKPIKSWTQPPIGQSDRADSPHYDDQAEKLFSKRTMKPTWWLPEDLAKHIESRSELPYASGSAGGDALAALIQTWERALEGGDLDALMACYAEDFSGQQNATKAQVRDFLSQAKSAGYLNGLKVQVPENAATVSGDTAKVEEIELKGSYGSMWVGLELENRGGAWLIVRSTSHD